MCMHAQLEERRKGNTAYKAGRLPEAQECYRRALAIVEYARGGSAADQAEVDHNKVGEGEGGASSGYLRVPTEWPVLVGVAGEGTRGRPTEWLDAGLSDD